MDKTDANGLFHYEETIITASDEDAKSVEAILYLSARQLSLEEALFSIGEI